MQNLRFVSISYVKVTKNLHWAVYLNRNYNNLVLLDSVYELQFSLYSLLTVLIPLSSQNLFKKSHFRLRSLLLLLARRIKFWLLLLVQLYSPGTSQLRNFMTMEQVKTYIFITKLLLVYSLNNIPLQMKKYFYLFR